MSLSENRHHEKRLKEKVKKTISKWFSKKPTEKQIGDTGLEFVIKNNVIEDIFWKYRLVTCKDGE